MDRAAVAPATPPAPAAPAAIPSLPAVPPSQLSLERTRFASLAGWGADAHWPAVAAFRRSCPRMVRDGPAPADLGLAGPAWNWAAICRAAAGVPAGNDREARAFFERWFEPGKMTDRGRADGLLTGYYEPELRGARAPAARFAHPLYKRPDDLPAARPYFTRDAIDKGALKGRGLELAWLANPIDAFVLHVQGSGRVVTNDGASFRVGFAGHNGHDYVAIGRELVKDGALGLDQVTMPAIRAWLERNPDKAQAMMARNPRYVFFRIVPPPPDDGLGPAGPPGALGVTLTAERSLAVDRAFLPLGLPVWIDAVDPRPNRPPLRRLTVAQDTGGAIKGPVRGDFFWGGGDAAEAAAGLMKSPAGFWVLLPRAQPLP